MCVKRLAVDDMRPKSDAPERSHSASTGAIDWIESWI